MTWFWENGDQLFILFLTPVVGLIFDFTLDKKKVLYLLCISLFLLLPILTGYAYIISYAYQVLGLLLLSSLYYFYSRQIEKRTPKIISAVIMAALAFCILGFFAFMESMSGNQEVKNSWRVKNYKIDYIKDQGFAGGPLMKYEISKYGFIPIFIKKVDASVDDDTTNSCLVHFSDIKMDFNKCKVTLADVK
jgi:hypothetical protein